MLLTKLEQLNMPTQCVEVLIVSCGGRARFSDGGAKELAAGPSKDPLAEA